MKLIQDKRAEKIISVYWFAILIVVAGGIFSMVYIFYGTPYDVREIESSILINKLADCISYGGKIYPLLISPDFGKSGEDLKTICHLNFNSSEWEEEQYYTKIDFYKIENMNAPFAEINAGNEKWLTSCEIQDEKKYERLAKCVRKSFYSVDDSGAQYIIKILAVVRKSEKNVKL